MDTQKELLIVNGKDKSNSVASFRFCGGKCNIVYKNSPKVYSYNSSNVQVLALQKVIDPSVVVVQKDGKTISGITGLYDFGEYIKITCSGKKDVSYPKNDVEIDGNCLADQRTKGIMAYFREIANAIGLKTEDGVRILSKQYEKITSVSEQTVLAKYLDSHRPAESKEITDCLIYPFGLNQSQKTAMENAFSSQYSIIQGPPGTGKTQTILNIIANAILQGKTIAVVSNNNSATSNVIEKLDKYGVSFLAAFLGSRANKQKFLESQTGVYPNMQTWVIGKEAKARLHDHIQKLAGDLSEMLNARNRLAELQNELMELKREQHYFEEYYRTSQYSSLNDNNGIRLSSRKLMSLWVECEHFAEKNSKPSLWFKIKSAFKYGLSSLFIFKLALQSAVIFLQRQFYKTKIAELQTDKGILEKKLRNYRFTVKMNELTKQSMALFKAELACRYNWKAPRPCFENSDFRGKAKEFNKEYPLILSTTYSIRGTLSGDYVYDYLLVDEASQVDVVTGVLAFSCAKNAVVVGDQKQLPNVIPESEGKIADEIWHRYNLPDAYRYSRHSLLSSAATVWDKVPTVLLREHYRCHPKIAGFCNQKFYHNQLLVMTEDHGETDVLAVYRTAMGSHARGHFNQRQIDIIRQEVIPRLLQTGHKDIGIISPYRAEVEALNRQVIDGVYEIDTVHKFQGREKESIILATVDNVISDFVDNPHLLNVAVSRAMKNICVVVSANERNEKTNLGDLVKYIEYNNFETFDSKVYSVFDLLYKEYSLQRKAFLKKYKRISQFDSENLMYAVIEAVLNQEPFQQLGCVIHMPFNALIKDYGLLTEEECVYAKNPLTHTDFLLFSKMDKLPVLVLEVDGYRFHQEGTRQADRDAMKNRILEKCGIPLLRFRTNESNEKERLIKKLQAILYKN